MNWIFCLLLAFAQFSPHNKPHEHTTQKNTSSKCSFAETSDLFFAKTPSDRQLLVFTSFSVPIATWKETSYYLERIKGAFVIRGLPNNSFQDLQKKILELRKEGILAEILLDPAAFEEYSVASTPTFLLRQDRLYDKASGNVTVPYVLSLFSQSGDASTLATELLYKVREN